MTAVFETDRLRAVPWRDDHAPDAFAAYSRPEFVQYLPNPVPHPDVAHTKRWLAAIRERPYEPGRGFWAIERREDDALVGATLCQVLPGAVEGEHEIGWHIFPDHQFQGYATEIGRGAAAYAFEVLGLSIVYAVVLPANAASIAVARAVGMQRLGRTDRYYGMETELFSLVRPGPATTESAAPRR